LHSFLTTWKVIIVICRDAITSNLHPSLCLRVKSCKLVQGKPISRCTVTIPLVFVIKLVTTKSAWLGQNYNFVTVILQVPDYSGCSHQLLWRRGPAPFQPHWKRGSSFWGSKLQACDVSYFSPFYFIRRWLGKYLMGSPSTHFDGTLV